MTIIKWVRKIFNSKPVQRFTNVIVYSAAVFEIGNSVKTVFNKTASIPIRINSGVKAGCCTTAVVAGYSSRVCPDPRIAALLEVCCVFSSSAYIFVGGEVGLGLSLMYTSKKTVG